jgi:hypothetical protein
MWVHVGALNATLATHAAKALLFYSALAPTISHALRDACETSFLWVELRVK